MLCCGIGISNIPWSSLTLSVLYFSDIVAEEKEKDERIKMEILGWISHVKQNFQSVVWLIFGLPSNMIMEESRSFCCIAIFK